MIGAWLPTVSGKFVDVVNLKPEDINVYDIAWSLSNTNRYNGHTSVPWDVLSHTGLAYQLYVRDTAGQTNKVTSVALLLHDASEAYLGDIIGLLKHTPIFDGYRELEKRVTYLIFKRFGIDADMVDWDMVDRYDKQATHVEIETLYAGRDNMVGVTPAQYPMLGRYPTLVKAQVNDFVDFLKQMLTGSPVNISEAFEMSDMMSRLLKQVPEPKVEPMSRVEAVDNSDVENMTV